jgi:hypothetical protein
MSPEPLKGPAAMVTANNTQSVQDFFGETSQSKMFLTYEQQPSTMKRLVF